MMKPSPARGRGLGGRGLAALAMFLALAQAGQAGAQNVPGDPYVGDPTGIVDDPCPAHPEPQTEAAQATAKLHQITRDYAQLCRYRRDDLELLARGQPVTVVFMGDSITDHWLQGDPSFWTPGVVNRGISGQTTSQMLLRFRQDVIALKPRAVHIMAGTNDIAGNRGPTTLATVEGNIASMAELARAHGVTVLIASTPPADHFDWSPGKQPADTIRTLNAWLKAYAARSGFAYVDYYAALATPAGAMAPALAKDGVHPTPDGYAAMRPIAKAALAKVR